jgi:preprotein translocase subunit YajC
MSFLISDAFADSAAGSAQNVSGGLMSVLPMILLLGLFMYFMIIRPQSKKAKEHKNLVGNLQKGDEVITAGGLLGKIEKIADDFLVINLSESNNITIQRSAVSNVVPKGTMKTVK